MSVSDPEKSIHKALHGSVIPQYVIEIPEDDSSLAVLDALLASVAGELAAVIIEPLVQAAGGMRFHSPRMLTAVAALAHQHQVLFIADEIATGFWRTGHRFACEEARVSPDILCLGKALTGGTVGLGATLARETIFESFLSNDWGSALMHGPTFMANPLACAAANASLDLFEREPRAGQLEAIESSLRLRTGAVSHFAPRRGRARQRRDRRRAARRRRGRLRSAAPIRGTRGLGAPVQGRRVPHAPLRHQRRRAEHADSGGASGGQHDLLTAAALPQVATLNSGFSPSARGIVLFPLAELALDIARPVQDAEHLNSAFDRSIEKIKDGGRSPDDDWSISGHSSVLGVRRVACEPRTGCSPKMLKRRAVSKFPDHSPPRSFLMPAQQSLVAVVKGPQNPHQDDQDPINQDPATQAGRQVHPEMTGVQPKPNQEHPSASASAEATSIHDNCKGTGSSVQARSDRVPRLSIGRLLGCSEVQRALTWKPSSRQRTTKL